MSVSTVGDKEETAVNIAVACNLIKPSAYMETLIVNTTTAPSLRRATAFFKAQLTRFKADCGALPAGGVTVGGVVITNNERNNEGNDEENGENNKVNLNEKGGKTEGKIKQKPSPTNDTNTTSGVEALSFTLQDAGRTLIPPAKPRALVIDGPSLLMTMRDSESRKLLLLLAQCCAAVVCCRVSPDQKREVVSLVKENLVNVR